MSSSDPSSTYDDAPQQPEEEKSLEELEEQLSQFSEQLNQCILLSQQEPENEEYGALIDDLQNAIQLTNELIRLKKESTTASSSTFPGPQFQEGDYCYGLYEGLWYVAVVTKVIDNTKKLQLASESPSSKKPAYEYFVRYVGYGNSEFVSKERYTIKEYYHPPSEFLQQGARCLAVNANDPDGMYEEAVVDKLTDKETVWVTFKERGVLQEVPLQLVRVGNEHFYDPKYKPKKPKKKEVISNESQSGQAIATVQTLSNKATTEAQGKKYEQSEADIIAKKKKKQEKRQQKLQEQEKQLNQKKQSWQSFMSRNSSTYKNTGKTLQATEKTYTPAQKKTKFTTSSSGAPSNNRPNNR
ncbi:hypothetical protein FDP41_012832 [Naegleria fowleri]|uniref:Tudor domain-containing protein n=1 Tax=Naegleria fowleri TaxID=5763 RepID=A0A6A5C3F9_NAEFO|nr:uncharacterized protein FDP41_012832 [Naegleria fowleri]KAF0981044.1 hypothetical protein FDP41_012832 [Naegleria fowleri]CAG4709851.1 unnamed protein product [Naegleria fowleri]